MPPRSKAPSAAAAAPAPAGGATPAAVPKPRKPRAPKAPKAAPPAGEPALEKRADDAAADAQPPAKKRRVRAPRAAKPADEAGSDILNALPDAALSHVLSLLPLDERARLACACRRLRALVAEIQSATICFKGVTATVVDEATVEALITRAGPALRCLDLTALPQQEQMDLVALQLLPALRDGGCFELEELRVYAGLDLHVTRELREHFPRLRRGTYLKSLGDDDCAEVLSALPGLELELVLVDRVQRMPQLAEALAAQVSAPPNVITLVVDEREVPTFVPVQNPLDLDALASALSCMPKLNYLRLNHCQPFGTPGVAALSGLLRTTTLRELTLTSCDINAACALAVLGSPLLEMLDVSRNRGLREDTGELGAAVGAHRTLRALALDRCDLSAATVASLGDALERSKSLRELSLSDSPSFRRGAERFFQGLERNTSLLDLALDRCAMGAACTRAAMRAVSRQGRLKRLSLANNELLDDGAAVVAAMLARKTCSLLYLNLESNGILGPGGIALAEAIGRNASLTALKLSENSCGVPAAAKALAAGLGANKSLRHLELRWWSLSGGSLAALGRAVGAHPALEALDLSFNDVGDAGARAMAAALEQTGGCATLRTLKMSDCSVGAGGARAFAKALRANTALRLLDLGGNDELNMGAFHALRQAFRDNGKLRQLQLGPELPDLNRGNPEEWDFE